MMFNIIIGWELFYNGEYDMQNVLVCDDDEAILESLRIYLDNAGFNVITAVDGSFVGSGVGFAGLGVGVATAFVTVTVTVSFRVLLVLD